MSPASGLRRRSCPEAAWGRSIIAWYAQANFDFDGATRTYRDLISRFPAETEARQDLGAVLAGEGRYEEAGATIRRALELDPDSPMAHNTLSGLYMATTRFDLGVAEGSASSNCCPSEPNALDSLGLAYDAQGDFRKAEQAYRSALNLDAKFELAITHLANTLYRMGRYHEALERVNDYIRFAPSDAERFRGYEQLAVLYQHLGRFGEAQAALGRITTGAHAEQILLALRLLDLPRADRLLARLPPSLDRGPRGSQRFRSFLMGERAMADSHWSQAFDYFRQSLQARPPYFWMDWYEDCLADGYLRAGRTDEAIREYQRVTELYPRLALVWFGLGKAYQKKGLEVPARQAIGHVLEIWKEADPEIPELAAAKELANGPARVARR